MRPQGLLDTGAILALLDRDDAWHDRCEAAFGKMRLPLATSAAVLAELFHMLLPHEWNAAWGFLRSGAVRLVPVTDEHMPALETLMRKYRDRPMDLADATLVEIANRLDLTTILTVDLADFETYRIRGRKRFRLLPGR